MKSREWLFGFFSSLVAVPAISQTAPEPPRAEAAPAKDLPTIVRLRERDHEIIVKSDGTTLYYTIVGESEEKSRANLKIEEIRAWNPDLYERLKSTIANPKIDASNQYDEKRSL